MNILDTIKKIKESGIKNAAIAKAIGVNRSSVTRWLNESRKPELDHLQYGRLKRFAKKRGF
jgi:transposase